MSTVIIMYKENSAGHIIAQSHDDLLKATINATAATLKKDPQEVIVGFESWQEPVPANAPDILLRAETSMSRKDLIDQWAADLLNEVRSIIELKKGLRIAVKSYVLDSRWKEETIL